MDSLNRLIYVMDPQCGWCYGNSHNMTSIYSKYKSLIDFKFMNARGGIDFYAFQNAQTPVCPSLVGARSSETRALS